MLKQYLMVVFLMLTFAVAQAAEYSADMTAEELETALASEKDIEAAVERAIQAGVDPVLVVESAIKVAPDNMATSIKTAAVVASPVDKQTDVFNAADKAINTKRGQSQSAQGGASRSSGGSRGSSFSSAFTSPGGLGGATVGNSAGGGGGATAPQVTDPIDTSNRYFAP